MCKAPSLPTLVLARSTVHRFGVFTVERIAARTVLVNSAGSWLPLAEAVKDKSEELLEHPEDVLRVWRSEQPDWITFINHSGTPNCVVRVIDDNPWLSVGALVILPGSELTIDYGSRYQVD